MSDSDREWGGQRRAQPYTGRPSLYRLPGERFPVWACTCPGLKPWTRHPAPSDCLRPEVIAAWRARHPEATCSERTARALAWLAQEFGR